MFQINIIRDPSVALSGVNASTIQQVENVIAAAADIWGRYIDAPDAVIDINMSFLELGGATLASAGQYYYTYNGIDYIGTVSEELTNNGDIDVAGTVDATLNVDLSSILDNTFFYDTTFDPDETVPASQIDFVSVMLHEMGHMLGISSYPGVSNFDDFIVYQNGNYYFTGANAVAANGGEYVQLYTDKSHLAIEDLMDPSISTGQRGLVTPVHVGIWKDLGLSVAEASNSADVLYGYDSVDDTIEGLDGDDTIFGLTGNDTLSGGDGADQIDGGQGNDLIYGGSGPDTLDAGAGNDRFFDADGMSSDSYIGGDGLDVVEYTVGTTFDFSAAGADTLDATVEWARFHDVGGVTVTGTSAANGYIGGVGDDTFMGGAGNDWLVGQTGDDQIAGEAGNDRLDGSDGADTITGGAGNDSLYGGGADGDVDTFVFEDGWGSDQIWDFEDGVDIIDLSAVNGVSSIDDLTTTESLFGTFISFDSNQIFLHGITAAQITASDFDFTTQV